MDKILKVLKNRWFLLGVSFLSFIYIIMMFNVIDNVFTCYLEVENFSAMMVLYVFLNFIFGAIMFFTRKQIPTIITALVIPFLTFVLMIVGFGQWHFIIPPLIVSAVIFLSCGVGESCKTVMGTLLLIMFVVGGLAYNIMCEYLDINLFYVTTEEFTSQGQDLDFSARSKDYLETSDGKYRLVHYVEQKGDNNVVSYYVEEAFKDKEYPFVICRKVFGCKRVLVSVYERDINPRWVNNTTLSIDGKTVNVVELLAQKKKPEDDEEAAETGTGTGTAATTPKEAVTAETDAAVTSAASE